MELIHPITGEISATATSLDLPEDMSFDDWKSFGETLCRGMKGVNWWIGDWWNGGHRYGERAKLAAEGIFGRDFGTLMNIASVARAFETSRRREVLSWSAHVEVAKLPPAQADELLARAEEEQLSVRELRQVVNQRKVEVGEQPSSDTCTTEDLHAIVARGTKFGTVYADPPWLYDNQGTRAATGNHYGGMTVDELCALPVRELAADDAHLHLWTTNAFLFDCQRIFDAWGFEYRSAFVWVKPQLGIINLWLLQRWAFGWRSGRANLYRYEQKVQQAHSQANTTTGRIVPVADLKREGFVKVFHPRQVDLWPEAAE